MIKSMVAVTTIICVLSFAITYAGKGKESSGKPENKGKPKDNTEVQSTTRHVCAVAQGTGDGSSQANCENIASNNSNVGFGDTVKFYDDGGNFDCVNTTLTPNVSPTQESERIIYEAASGETPTWNSGVTLGGPWTKESGTDGVDAIYSMAEPNVRWGTQRVVFESDPGKESEDSLCFNVPEPRPGGALGTGNECSYGGIVAGAIGASENGDTYNANGKTFVRTSHADSPNNYTLISTQAGVCINIDNKSYITLSGLKFRYVQSVIDAELSDNVIIDGFDVKYVAGYAAINLKNATNDIVRNSKILWAGTMDGHRFDCIGHKKGTSNTLIENNEFGMWGHTCITAKSDQMVIRNNYFHDGGGKPIGTDGDNLLFLYNNRFRGCRGASQLKGTGHPNDHPCITISGSDNIVAFNEMWGKKSRAIFHGRPYNLERNYFYHNTIVNSTPDSKSEIHITGPGTYKTNGVIIKNNLIGPFNTTGGTECTALEYQPDKDGNPSTTGSEIEGNYFYSGIGCTNYFRIDNTFHTVANFESIYSSEVANNIAGNAPSYINKSFDNPNFGLLSDSEGIDDGVFLTVTSSKCSDTPSTVRLVDAGYFFSINAMITNGVIDNLAPHTITIGNDTGLKVKSRSGNVITLDQQITCSKGENVSFDYVGSAPDPGANESTN